MRDDERMQDRAAERLEELKLSHARALEDGADEDSYNIAWLDGAIYELTRLVEALQ